MGRSFLASVERYPNALAISDHGVRYTYSEWLDDILRVVTGFEKNKIKFGHHIITMPVSYTHLTLPTIYSV